MSSSSSSSSTSCSSSSSSSSFSSSSSSDDPLENQDLCQVPINNKHDVDYRRKRKTIVLESSTGDQNWLRSEVKRLQKEVKQLKKENGSLMHLNWKLQKVTFPKMIDLLSRQASVNKNSGVAARRASDMEATSKSIIAEIFSSTRRQTRKRTTVETKINNTNNSAAALCKFMSEEQLSKACQNISNYKKIIGYLMECLFTEGEMLRCSVTGINTSKQPLDSCKTTALIDFITANFPHVTVSQVKQRMGNKLRDKRQLQYRAATVNPAHWMLQQN